VITPLIPTAGKVVVVVVVAGGSVVVVTGAFTVRVATALVAEPAEFVKSARNSYPFSELDATRE
jgi:hypothetical protein